MDTIARVMQLADERNLSLSSYLSCVMYHIQP